MEDMLEIVIEDLTHRIESHGEVPLIIHSEDDSVAFVNYRDEELPVPPDELIALVEETIASLEKEFSEYDPGKLYSAISVHDCNVNQTLYVNLGLPFQRNKRTPGLVYLEIPRRHFQDKQELSAVVPYLLTEDETSLFEDLYIRHVFGDDEGKYGGMVTALEGELTEELDEVTRAWVVSSIRHEFGHHVTPSLAPCYSWGTVGSFKRFKGLYQENALSEGFARLMERGYRPLPLTHGNLMKERIEADLSSMEKPFENGLVIEVIYDGFPPEGMAEQNCLAGLYVASTILEAFGEDRCTDIFLCLRAYEIIDKHHEACSVLSESLGYEVVPLF